VEEELRFNPDIDATDWSTPGVTKVDNALQSACDRLRGGEIVGPAAQTGVALLRPVAGLNSAVDR
jgi:hypothetical protein